MKHVLGMMIVAPFPLRTCTTWISSLKGGCTLQTTSQQWHCIVTRVSFSGLFSARRAAFDASFKPMRLIQSLDLSLWVKIRYFHARLSMKV